MYLSIEAVHNATPATDTTSASYPLPSWLAFDRYELMSFAKVNPAMRSSDCMCLCQCKTGTFLNTVSQILA